MRKIIFFVTLFYVNYSFACSPVNKNVGLFFDDEILMPTTPEKAAVAFTGLIIREKRKADDILKSDLKFIIPEQKWTVVQETKIQPSSLCGLSQKVGERYLFLSSTRDVTKEQILIELGNAGQYISILARRKDFIGDINPAWQYCRKDKECTSIKDACNTDISINREYKDIYLSFLKERGNKNCVTKTSMQKYKNKCINYFCS